MNWQSGIAGKLNAPTRKSQLVEKFSFLSKIPALASAFGSDLANEIFLK